MHYGYDFKIDGKDIYKTSIKEITPEEKTINKTNTDYILERLKEIEIDEKSYRSYSQVVQQDLQSAANDEGESVNSDDETCVTSNKSTTSNQSFETITDVNESTKQEQMSVKIENLQQVMAKCLAEQEKMNKYIFTLEDSLVSLAESQQGSTEYNEAKEKVEMIKKKIKKRKALKSTEQIEDDEQKSKKRMVPKTILKRPETNQEKEDNKRKEKHEKEEATRMDERKMNQDE